MSNINLENHEDRRRRLSSPPLLSMAEDKRYLTATDGGEEGTPATLDSRRLISTVYSGPTILDIERALFFTGTAATSGGENARPIGGDGSLFRGSNKMESKCTMTIKSNGRETAEDGYKWRKYGQKSIKGNANLRSYYKCTNPRCGAKKQVERSKEDPETLVVTYEGLHLHFSYPHYLFFHGQRSLPSPNKAHARGTRRMGQEQAHSQPQEVEKAQEIMGLAHEGPTNYGPQGLLEDVVPMNILKPPPSFCLFPSK